jgi:hypothetical protein
MWYFTSFYHRFFDICPFARSFFKDSVVRQGRTLVGFMSHCVSTADLSDHDTREVFRELVLTGTCDDGDAGTASGYSLFYDTVLWTLEHCLGSGVFTAAVRLSWLKAISRLWQIIVPMVVRQEMRIEARREREEEEAETKEIALDVVEAGYGDEAADTASRPRGSSASTSHCSLPQPLYLSQPLSLVRTHSSDSTDQQRQLVQRPYSLLTQRDDSATVVASGSELNNPPPQHQATTLKEGNDFNITHQNSSSSTRSRRFSIEDFLRRLLAYNALPSPV